LVELAARDRRFHGRSIRHYRGRVYGKRQVVSAYARLAELSPAQRVILNARRSFAARFASPGKASYIGHPNGGLPL
jgi:hypothetical protein